MIQITAIICTTVVILYSVYKWWEWENSYVDEILEKGQRICDNIRTGSWYEVKRTYKNGKVTYKNLNL